MRVFYLTTELPFPPTGGGRVRSLAELRLIASLPEVMSVRVLALHEGDVAPADARALEAAVPKVSVAPLVFHPIHVFRHPRAVPRLLYVRLAKQVPYLAAKWDGAALRRALVSELRADRYDVVYLDHLGMALYLKVVRQVAPQARIVLEQHNVESDFFGQFAREKRGLVKPIAYVEWLQARAFEANSLRKVDAVVAISSPDATTFERLSGVRAHVVPQAVTYEPRSPSPAHPPEVGYVGSLGWRPNAQGLDWVCREVWPLVRARVPGLTLSIVGSGLPDGPGGPIVPAAWQVDGVKTLGFVRDLAPHEARWSAMVAPVSPSSRPPTALRGSTWSMGVSCSSHATPPPSPTAWSSSQRRRRCRTGFARRLTRTSSGRTHRAWPRQRCARRSASQGAPPKRRSGLPGASLTLLARMTETRSFPRGVCARARS